jgi:transcription initiation factor TFIID subunit 10
MKRNKRDVEKEKKEQILAETLMMMDEFTPIIPDAVTDYHLAVGGLETDDVRIKRLLALSAQKFITDIATGRNY